MSFIKKFKGVIVVIGIFVIVLVISFYYPERQNISTDVQVNESVKEDFIEETAESAKTQEIKIPINEDVTIETTDSTDVAIKETIKPTSEAHLEIPEPDESKEIKKESVEKNTLSCFLTVRCDTLLDNMDRIAPEKIHLIPESGLILPEIEIEFSEGESVFDVLQRELKRCKIHLEFTRNPMYDSVYIEGIGNLYEFDAGNLSGWIFRVNGEILSVGCSQYKLKNADKIEFLYTCNMGKDF